MYKWKLKADRQEPEICFVLVCLIFVRVHQPADKRLPGHRPEESEAKLGHLVPQPGTDQSAPLPLSVCRSLLSLSLSLLHMNTHIHPRPDRQASPPCSLSGALMAFVRQPRWRRQAWHTVPPWHAGIVISPFRKEFGVISPPLRGKRNEALWAAFPLVEYTDFINSLQEQRRNSRCERKSVRIFLSVMSAALHQMTHLDQNDKTGLQQLNSSLHLCNQFLLRSVLGSTNTSGIS